MRRYLLPTLALASAIVVGGCLHAPMPWSPDGKWLAYVVEVRPVEALLKPGWLFESPTGEPGPPASAGPPMAYRIWATRGDTGASVLLEESNRPLTAPGWSPDGRALAFGRVVAEADGSGRFEVVVLNGPEHRRVLSSRPLAEITAEAARLPGQAIAWSPDHRYLAVPQLSPPGLAILKSDTGRQVHSINDAFLPSWSPDGSRLAFFLRGTGDTLGCIEAPIGPTRILAEVGQAGQAPAWTRDNLSVVVVARKSLPRGADPPGDQAELIRVRVDTGQSSTIRPLTAEGVLTRDRSVQGISIAMDPDGENLFCSTVVEGLPRQVTWYRPKEDETWKNFAIVDYTAPMGSLSLSPDGRTLAARVGPVERITAPALCDLGTPDFRSRLIAPDDASRVEWVSTLLASARTILSSLPTASPDPNSPTSPDLERPSLLPIRGEFESGSELGTRLRRIGRLGRPLCDRPPDAGPLDPTVSALLDEARLFFDYLGENYSAALTSLEALEAKAETPDRRLKLLGIRAQIFIAQGNVERAEHTISYLRKLIRKPGRRIESDGSGGFAVEAEEKSPAQGWADYLAFRAARVHAMLHGDDDEEQPNLDAQRFRFGLEPFDPRRNQLFPERPFLNDPNMPLVPGMPVRLRSMPRVEPAEGPK